MGPKNSGFLGSPKKGWFYLTSTSLLSRTTIQYYYYLTTTTEAAVAGGHIGHRFQRADIGGAARAGQFQSTTKWLMFGQSWEYCTGASEYLLLPTDITTTIVQYKTDWPFNKEQKSNISPDIQLPPGQPFPRN